uniref:vomeronasal type-1 receptor 4-like n=1 Tax=Jaculus jaculus TaxID=51337 RepID=UPI001E1B58E1|nr:vomeronasal type-1 receptor 4-like [Jaculus jaculus]
MDLKDLSTGIVFLSQTTLGILGNFFLLSHYLALCYQERSLRTTDVILKHLVIANFLVILSKGVPHTMASFGFKQFFNDLGCTVLLFVHRVGRSMSIGSTCFLSVFQAITIVPNNSYWKDVKVKATKYIDLFISLCWILYMVVNFIFPMYLYTKLNCRNRTEKRDFEYCATVGRDEIVDYLYVAMVVFPEILLSVLIICSSGSMVVILYRHRRRVQHIHSTNVPSRASPESRATQSILVLVFTFLAFHTISSILNSLIALFNSPSLWLVSINALISMCFPSMSPFVFISHDFIVSRIFFDCVRNTTPLMI